MWIYLGQPKTPGHLSRSEKVKYWKVGQELLGTTFHKALSKDDFLVIFAQLEQD